MSDIHIQYQGFHPSEATQNYILKYFDKISINLPKTAAVNIRIIKKNKFLNAYVFISSKLGKIYAHAESINLNIILKSLLFQIRKKNSKIKNIYIKNYLNLINQQHKIDLDESSIFNTEIIYE